MVFCGLFVSPEFSWNVNVERYRTLYQLPRQMRLDVDYAVTFQPSASGPVRDIALDTTLSSYLLAGYQDGSVVLFDVDNPHVEVGGQQVFRQFNRTSKGPSAVQPSYCSSSSSLSPVVCIQWYPVDSGAFYTASVDKSVKLWDTNRFQCVEALRVAELPAWIALSECAVSHNLVAVALARGADARAVLIDPLIGAVALNLVGGHSATGLSFITWSPRSSNCVITTGHDGRILFWDIRTPAKPFCSLDRYRPPEGDLYSPEDTAHTGSVLSLAFSTDGMHLFSWGGAGSSENATCLRMWSSGPVDTASSVPLRSTRPVLRPVNFGTNYTCASSSDNRRWPRSRQSTAGTSSTQFDGPNASAVPSQRTKRSSVRMAVASGSPGTVWGGEESFVYVPNQNRLLISSTCKQNTATESVVRHHDEMRACVWNPLCQELYTCAMDGNLFSWPLYRHVTEDDLDGDLNQLVHTDLSA